jgi:hypothetical protein
MECCDNSGGRVIFNVDGRRYQTRGGFTIAPTTFEKAAAAHDDGSIYTTTRPVPASATMTLSDRCGLTLNDLVNACHVDATIDLIDMKKRYLFTRATVIGRPEIISESGEIRGLSIVSSLVKELPYS